MALPWLAFAALFCMLPVAFLYEKGGRVLFYYCAYFSLAGVVIELWQRKKVKLTDKKALAILLLGVIYVGWSIYFQYVMHTVDGLYYTAGKRFILAWLIMVYMMHCFRTGSLNKKLAVRYAFLSLSLAFITSSCFGIFQSITTDERIVLGINRATMTAYAYSIVMLALISLILRMPDSKLKKAFFLFVSIISLYVIMLTQTRSAMAIHTLFLAYMTVRLFAVTRNVKFIGCVALLLLLAVGLSYKLIETRVDTTVTEYTDYQQGNDKTSLGSRFTMWKTGILAFEHAPLGQTQDQRNKFITTYLDEHHQSDSWALIYINVHLHNEFIQFASLFGVVGVLMLLYFFFTLIVVEIRSHQTITPLAIASVAMLLYGMTDVLLTSVEFIAMFGVLVVLLSLIENAEGNKKAP
ncbi:O-antigen ligase family protein [Type-D symbiont of Plautia stali]|uniref:O-antigen ligase family protein n=1 Tax=Type-D symbiont of Plautia stali TaxID=1560356 RepID=UPI001428B8C8|nr:O-antigen ligase family protein [Type-D symbiont of Plautia stali]